METVARTNLEPVPPTPGEITPSLPGTKTLLLGAPGSGKTTALTTLIEAGLETFVLITDPGGEEALLDTMADKKLPLDKLHYNYVAPASPPWETLEKMAKTIGLLSYGDLSSIKKGADKEKYQQFIKMLGLMANFKCSRTGREYGAIDHWGPDRAFAVDSLSGINTMAFDMMVGAKPTAHEGEWGVAMIAEERLVKKLCSDLKCFFVLTAHIEREPDIVTGSTKIMVGALGRKLAPKLPKDFSDVVLAYREGTDFYWSTVAPNTDLKARTLPLQDKLSPSFGQVVKKWKERLAAISK